MGSELGAIERELNELEQRSKLTDAKLCLAKALAILAVWRLERLVTDFKRGRVGRFSHGLPQGCQPLVLGG